MSVPQTNFTYARNYIFELSIFAESVGSARDTLVYKLKTVKMQFT